MIGHPKKRYRGLRVTKCIERHICGCTTDIDHSWWQRCTSGHSSSVLLEQHLKNVGARFDTLYQMDEGHVPRPPAMKHVLARIQQWMTDIETGTKF